MRREMFRGAIDANAGNVHVPASNTAAVITIPAVAKTRIIIEDIFSSYSLNPSGGRLQMTDGGTTVLDIDITETGIRHLISQPLRAEINSEVVVTLAAGGVSAVGKLNVYWRRVTEN